MVTLCASTAAGLLHLSGHHINDAIPDPSWDFKRNICNYKLCWLYSWHGVPGSKYACVCVHVFVQQLLWIRL